jgi:hypothetical protein
MALCCGAAQAATHKKAQPAAPEGKAIRDAKTVQAVVPERRVPLRLITFNERFYPGIGRTFTTWW